MIERDGVAVANLVSLQVKVMPEIGSVRSAIDFDISSFDPQSEEGLQLRERGERSKFLRRIAVSHMIS